MKTKRLLLGALIAGILTIIFGGKAFATAGNTAEISGGKTWNICVDAGAGYAGSDFAVNIAKTDFASQIVLGNGDCKAVEMAAGTYTVSLNSTMGVGAVSHEITDDTLTFSVANSLRKYLNTFGSIAYTVEGSGESPYELLFSMPGECQFNGNANVSGETCKDGDGNPLTNKKYIDTNVALFSEENAGRDFEIYFTLTDYAKTQPQNQATLFNAKYENSSMYYPGFTLRTLSNNGDTLELTGRFGKDNTDADKANIKISGTSIKGKEVKIVRVDGMVSYSIDGGELIPFQNYKNFSRYFEQTAVFGASMQTNGTPQRYFDGTIKDIRVYLKKDTTAKIVFDANGGMGTMAAIEDIEIGTDVVLPANAFTREYYEFAGWSTEGDGTGVAYGNGATITVNSSDEIYLYAQWVGAKADIIFDANGGEGSMEPILNIVVGVDITLPTNSFTRSTADYVFKGWNTKKDGTGVAYEDGATITVNTAGKNRLYAQWRGLRAVLKGNLGMDFEYLADGGLVEYERKIKAVRSADTLPSEPSLLNRKRTISSSMSPVPIYAWFDDSDVDNDGTGDGVIYVYADADTIYVGENSLKSIFYNFYSLTDISALADWDASEATNVYGMFHGAKAIADISALADWDVSGVTDMSSMFYGASSLMSLSALADWDVSGVTNMQSMFSNTSSLTDISALAEWDVSKVTNMKLLFEGASSLTDISALANWDISGITDMLRTFAGTGSLTDISALAEWDVSEVTNMSSMFFGAASLTDLSALAEWDVSGVTNMSSMFDNAKALTNLSALADWDVSGVTNMQSMFSDTSSLTDISALADWDVSGVTDMSSMFSNTEALTDLSALAEWDVSGVTNMSSMFSSAKALTNLSALADWDVSGVTYMGAMFSDADSLVDISGIANWDTSSVTNMSSMFNSTYCRGVLTDISALANWDTSNVKNMKSMFNCLRDLSDISALANWDTSNVTNMSDMYDSTSLSDISALANWNTSNVTDMSTMFRQTDITNVDALKTEQHTGNNYVSWDVSNVINMNSMFETALSLADISGLANWDTSSVTNMGRLFASIKASDISALTDWNTSNVANMSRMFYRSTTSDLSPLTSWNTSKVTDMSYMFCEARSITNLSALANWDVSSLKDMSYMFDGATSLSDTSAINDWDIDSTVTNTHFAFINNATWSYPSWYH